MVALNYTFPLPILQLEFQKDLLRYSCQRTGKRYRDDTVPLYQTRVASNYLSQGNHLVKLIVLGLVQTQNLAWLMCPASAQGHTQWVQLWRVYFFAEATTLLFDLLNFREANTGALAIW